MIDTDFVNEKVNLISRDLVHLQCFAKQTFDEVAGDFIKYSALKNILMETIGRAIDINSHLVAELSEIEGAAPKTYAETFLRLADFGVLPQEFADKIARSAGFRNAIVHEYNNLNSNEVYQTIGEAIDQYANYCQFIRDYLTKSQEEEEN